VSEIEPLAARRGNNRVQSFEEKSCQVVQGSGGPAEDGSIGGTGKASIAQGARELKRREMRERRGKREKGEGCK